jgi:rubrerythrin
MDKTSVDDILNFAILSEQSASKFYTDLAAKMDNQAMREVFEEFARQELAHKAKLEKVKREGVTVLGPSKDVPDLKIADYLVDVEPKPDMTYLDAIIIAMKREKAAFRLYTDLAAVVPNENCRNLFLALAQEEANHKLRFELEYDEHVMQEN